MYSTKSNNGGFVYPSETKQDTINYHLAGYGGIMHIIGLRVSHGASDFKDYVKEMNESEKIIQLL